MAKSADPDDEVRQLLQEHVPEVGSGVVELVSIARDPGKRVFVAVRSNDPEVNPISACVGKMAVHAKAIMRELGGAKVSIVLWSDSPAVYILAALAPFAASEVGVPTPKVALDAEQHVARIQVAPETLKYFAEQGGSRVRLVSKLVGWDIRLVSHEKD